MSEKPADYGREVRETIVKSSLTGVAATVLAVTIFSPAGLGGMIGTSLASNVGADPNTASADDPYARLPAFPAPLSPTELETIRSQLARTSASLEITRAATDERIEHIRSIAMTQGAVTYAPMRHASYVGEGLRLTTSEPEPIVSVAAAEPAPAPTPAVAGPTSSEAAMVAVSYIRDKATVEYRDPHLELADLLLAHENY